MIKYNKSVRCRQFAGTCHRKDPYMLQNASLGVKSFARRPFPILHESNSYYHLDISVPSSW